MTFILYLVYGHTVSLAFPIGNFAINACTSDTESYHQEIIKPRSNLSFAGKYAQSYPVR